MAALLPCAPNVVSAPLGNRSTCHFPHRPYSHAFSGSTARHFLRGSLTVARFGFKPDFLPEPDEAEGVLRELFGRAEGLLYTIADAAVSSSSSSSSDTVAASYAAKQSNDWLSGIANYMETVLKVLLSEAPNSSI